MDNEIILKDTTRRKQHSMPFDLTMLCQKELGSINISLTFNVILVSVLYSTSTFSNVFETLPEDGNK